jgi:hypothetical protein
MNILPIQPPSDNGAVDAFHKFLSPHFPDDQYGKNKSIVTHYLVFKGSKNGLEQWLSKSEQVAARVQTVVTSHKLNPLHIACMLGRVDEARLILQKAKVLDVNGKDAKGWTALHFAAAINNDDLKALLQQNGAKSFKNNLGATPADITRMVYYRKNPQDQRFFYEENNKIVQGNGTTFCALTGAETYADEELRFSPAIMAKQWIESKVEDNSPPWFIKRYENFCLLAREENVYLKKVNDLGWEVFSRRTIKAEEYIHEYFGEVLEEKDSQIWYDKLLTEASGDYSFPPIDASKHRSLVSMVNDGFPNVMCAGANGLKGSELRTILVALEDLPKGTALHFNYGIGHRCKFGVHKEVDLPKAIAYYTGIGKKGFTLSKWFDQMAQKSVLERNRLRYLANTPSLIVYLVVNQVVKIQEVIDLWRHPAIKKESQGAGYGFVSYLMGQVLKGLREIEPHLKTLEQEQIEKISIATETLPIDKIIESLRLVCPKAGIKPMDLHPPAGCVLDPLDDDGKEDTTTQLLNRLSQLVANK